MFGLKKLFSFPQRNRRSFFMQKREERPVFPWHATFGDFFPSVGMRKGFASMHH